MNIKDMHYNTIEYIYWIIGLITGIITPLFWIIAIIVIMMTYKKGENIFNYNFHKAVKNWGIFSTIIIFIALIFILIYGFQ